MNSRVFLATMCGTVWGQVEPAEGAVEQWRFANERWPIGDVFFTLW